ncbi:hypothetical protein KIPB_001608, partial [Kipferlia bialata]
RENQAVRTKVAATQAEKRMQRAKATVAAQLAEKQRREAEAQKGPEMPTRPTDTPKEETEREGGLPIEECEVPITFYSNRPRFGKNTAFSHPLNMPV